MDYYEGDNIGSLATAEIANHTDFSSFNPAVFKDGKGWTLIPFKEGSGNLAFTKKDTANGIVYSYAVRLYIQNWRDEVDEDIDPFMGPIPVMRTVDMNGAVRILGAPGTPGTLEESGGTGDSYTAENGQELQFKIDQSFKAFKL